MWYTYAQSRYEKIPHPLLKYLAAEARKCNTFEEFKYDYVVDIKHGLYWHFTRDKGFMIAPSNGPTDKSSMGDSFKDVGKLMMTSHPEYWDYHYNYPEGDEENRYPDDYEYARPYAALINMQEVPRDSYRQVARGMGNEFMVDDPSKARVEQIMHPTKALKFHEDYFQHLQI